MAEPIKKAASKDAPVPKAKKPSVLSPTAPSAKKGGQATAAPVQKPKPAASASPVSKKNPEETDDFVEIISQPVSGAWDFLQKGYPSVYISLLKLNLVRNVLYFLSIVALFAILFGIAIAFPGYATTSPLIFWGALLFIMLAGLALILWMVQSFESAAYILVAQKLVGKPYSMAGALGSASRPTFKYAFIDLLLRLIVLAPGLLLFLLPFGIQMGTGMNAILAPGLVFAYIAFLIYYFFANIVYEFLTQFWRYGFLFEGFGVIASLKRALALIRSRPIETFVFDLVYVVALLIFSIPSFVFSVVAYFVLMFVQLFSLMALGMAGYAVYIAVALILSAVGIVFSSMMETACRPLHYLYWKGIAERAKK
ncbi:MAG: hypothetical protein V1861_04495 [Candidatus Micrarchaeota archaeon]